MDTGRRLLWSHISWSVSEAGTRLTPCRIGGPRQLRHPCWKHNKCKILATRADPSIKNPEHAASLCFLQSMSRMSTGQFSFLSHNWNSLSASPTPPLNLLQQGYRLARSEGGPGQQVTHRRWRWRNCKQLPLFRMLPRPADTDTHTTTQIDAPTPAFLRSG